MCAFFTVSLFFLNLSFLWFTRTGATGAFGGSFEEASDQRPQPWIQLVCHYMDNCSGTNKSQQCFGALSLLVMLGNLSAMWIKFMIPGHTKFESDVAAQKTACSYNCADCFNHGDLNDILSPYVSAKAYDGNLIQMLKGCTARIFAAVYKITKHREFFVIGDDGFVQRDLREVFCNEEANFEAEGGTFYSSASLETAAQNAAERALMIILPAALEEEGYYGVGDLNGLLGPQNGLLGPLSSSGKRLFPYRRVRMFMRFTENDSKWREQLDYHLPSCRDDADIALALSEIVSFENAPEEVLSSTEAPYFGQKVKHLQEMYRNFVPPYKVPDYYEVGGYGQSGRITNDVVRAELGLTSPAPNPAGPASDPSAETPAPVVQQPETPAPVVQQPVCQRRWNKVDDDEELLKICKQVVPTKAKHFNDIALKIGADDKGATLNGDQVKRAVARLLKKDADTFSATAH
jgi:hypothetical protein